MSRPADEILKDAGFKSRPYPLSVCCLNCGSEAVERQICESPSDDFDEYWCEGCDLPVNVGVIRDVMHHAEVVEAHAKRLRGLETFMEGCGY